jgi:hypothetical protein
MPDEVTPERVAAIAAAARVPLEQAEAARAANATMTRFTAQRIALSLEVEPATIRLWPASTLTLTEAAAAIREHKLSSVEVTRSISHESSAGSRCSMPSPVWKSRRHWPRRRPMRRLLAGLRVVRCMASYSPTRTCITSLAGLPNAVRRSGAADAPSPDALQGPSGTVLQRGAHGLLQHLTLIRRGAVMPLAVSTASAIHVSGPRGVQR